MSITMRLDRPDHRSPVLPQPRGPLSAVVLRRMEGDWWTSAAERRIDDPYSEDAQLALYCCYELHYRGFDGVSERLEWDPELLRVRHAIERAFLSALRRDVRGGGDVRAEGDALLTEPPDAWGVSHHLRRDGELWQLREYVAHRSMYHLKEADPQAWVIPRLPSPVKAALVTVQHDEYGAGDPHRVHARLFADMMDELGLCSDYGAYLDAAPAATLAEVNLMSMYGLHRALRGALIGQFATVELTSSPGSDRLVRALRRLGCGPAAIAFYDEHVEADAVHEQIMRRGVLAPLLEAEPELAADVVLGIQTSTLLGDRLAEHLLGNWTLGRPSLRTPLPTRGTTTGAPLAERCADQAPGTKR